MTGQHIDATFAALADPTRRAVIDLLSKKPISAGAIAREFNVSLPAMSRQLRVLRTTGLIEDRRHEKDARIRLYQLKRGRLEELSGWLQELERFWTSQMQSLKDYSERGNGE